MVIGILTPSHSIIRRHSIIVCELKSFKCLSSFCSNSLYWKGFILDVEILLQDFFCLRLAMRTLVRSGTGVGCLVQDPAHPRGNGGTAITPENAVPKSEHCILLAVATIQAVCTTDFCNR